MGADGDFGTDVDCVDDIGTTLQVVSGQQNLSNALARRLLTPLGGLFYDPDYGFNLRDYLDAGLTDQGVQQLASQVAAEWRKDDRVQSTDIAMTYDPGSATFAITSVITTAVGSFDLVLSVSAVGITILNQGLPNVDIAPVQQVVAAPGAVVTVTPADPPAPLPITPGVLHVRSVAPGTGGTFAYISGTTYGFTPTVPLTADQLLLPLPMEIGFSSAADIGFDGRNFVVTAIVAGQIRFTDGGSPSVGADSAVRWALWPPIQQAANDEYGYPGKIDVVFDRDIDPATIDGNSFAVYTLTNAVGPVWTQSDPTMMTFSVAGSIVECTQPFAGSPFAPKPGNYKVVLSTDIKGVLGEVLAAPVTWLIEVNG